MHDYLIEMLVCPACHGGLVWEVAERQGNTIVSGTAECPDCGARYPVQEGIGVFLTPDLPRQDLWEEVESRLSTYLREHPDIERQLLETPLKELAPADQFFRSMILDERGEFAKAREAADTARAGLYTREYMECSERQIEFALQLLAADTAPVVDLASGMGHFVEHMARRLNRPIVATDFSPRVLRRDRRRFSFLGLEDRISLLAFDARRTPFRHGAVHTMTTYQGLLNIREPGELLRELRRVVSGTLVVLTFFFPEEDAANGALIHELGLTQMAYREPALRQFREAGWTVQVAASWKGLARPTPPSVLLEGAGMDALPAAETTLEWCVLEAH